MPSRSVLRSASFACAVLLAFVGCASEKDNDSPLSLQEVKAVLPNEKAVPDSNAAGEPAAYRIKEALSMGVTNCYS